MEPRDPDTRRDGREPGEEPSRGLAQEIRHEIEEAVQHVPRPVRWTVARILWVVGAAVAGLVVLVLVSALLWIANRTEWVAQEAALFVNQALAGRTDVALRVRDVGGNPLTGIRMEDPRVVFRAGGAPPLLAARSLTVRYGLWSLLTGGPGPVTVELDRPTITVVRAADGSWRLPDWKGGGRRGGPGRALDVRLVLRDGAIDAPEPLRVRGLRLEAAVTTGAETRIEVRRMSWTEGPWGSVLARLEAAVRAGDSVRVEVRALRTGDVDLSGRAAWAAAGGPRAAHVEVRRVRWAWLARVFRNGAFDVPGEGALVADARGDSTWQGTFTARATWNGLPAEGAGRFRYAAPRWRLERLTARSPAGNLSNGTFDYTPNDWALEADVVRGDPARWGAINVPGWPAGDLAGRFRYAVDTRRKDGLLTARLRGSGLAGWRVDSAAVMVRFVPDAPDSFVVDMTRRGGRARLAGATLAEGWRGTLAAEKLPLEEWPDGRASGIRGTLATGSGTLEGRADGLYVTGSCSGTDTEWLGARIGRWSLPAVEGRLLPTPDLALPARLETFDFLGVRFDSSALALRLGDARVTIAGGRAWASDTLVEVAGEAAWDEAGWRLELGRATARSRQFDWVAEAPVLLSGDPRGVRFDRLEARDGDAALAIRGRWAGPDGTYDWTMRGTRLDLGRLGLPPEWGLAGRADAGLRVTGRSGDPRWSFTGRVSRPAVQGHAGDSLALDLAGGPSRLELENLLYRLDGGTLSAAGEVSGTAWPWPDTLTAEGIRAWLAGGAAWRGELRADALPLDGLGALAPAAAGVGGRLSGQVRLGGRPGRPEVDLAVSAVPLRWHAYAADGVTLRAGYRDERLTVEDLRLSRGDLVSTVSGNLPVRLTLGGDAEILERDMAWTASIPNGDLAVAPAFVPQIGDASGRFEMEARVRGTPRHPDLEGWVRVRGGMVRAAAREELVEGLHADFTLDEARITLDSLAARQGPRGEVRGQGVVDLDGFRLRGYRFDLALRNFTASEAGLYAAELDGDFVVTDGVRRAGQTLPMVAGEARLRRAAILLDFANQSEGQQLAATTQPLFWTYQVRVLANDQLRWRPPDADIEFNADLSIEQTADSLLIYGEMSALRGTYYFLSNRFTVTRADLVFDNLNGVNPMVEAEATTRVTPVGAVGLDLGDAAAVPHTVTVTIQGRADAPGVTFASDPPDMDESGILRALTLGSVYDAGAGQVRLQDPLDSYLTKALNRTLSAELSRTFNNYLNDWQLEREQGGLLAGQGGLVVSVSTQPWRNVNVRYRQRLPGAGREPRSSDLALDDPLERSVEAEYRLNRFFYVTSELTQRRVLGGGTATVNATPDFNLNLKARWEY